MYIPLAQCIQIHNRNFLTFQQGASNDLTNNLPIHFYLTIFLKDFVANC